MVKWKQRHTFGWSGDKFSSGEPGLKQIGTVSFASTSPVTAHQAISSATRLNLSKFSVSGRLCMVSSLDPSGDAFPQTAETS